MQVWQEQANSVSARMGWRGSLTICYQAKYLLIKLLLPAMRHITG